MDHAGMFTFKLMTKRRGEVESNYSEQKKQQEKEKNTNTGFHVSEGQRERYDKYAPKLKAPQLCDTSINN